MLSSLAEPLRAHGPRALIAGAFTAWIGVTAASQHPHRAFDRLRSLDPLGMAVPNWRFFAPEPAQHDYHVLHRVLTATGDQTPWRETTEISPRRTRQVVWFPDRRREKATFDLASELITLMAEPAVDLTQTVPFDLLRARVEQRVRDQSEDGPLPQGFQFLLARHTGYDDSGEPDYILASPFCALEAA
ncbi:MAG: hypothetical protein JHC95_03980 [Solirubrobacteraceae bacterium]|nr:hypothetical protein [Solirubrobacteraceae bacterium]